MAALRVLLVDDEEDLVHTMVERLNLRGLDAVGVLNGSDALDRLAEREFDVVVLDLKMPGISGEDLLARIEAEHPNVRVILITGHGVIHTGEEELEKQAREYLVKPFDIETLIKTMKELTNSQ